MSDFVKKVIHKPTWIVTRDSLKYRYLQRNSTTLTMEDITDADYKYAKRVWQNFGIKTPDEYHGLYVQSNTLLLEDIFESLQNKYIKIYKVDCARFFLATMLEESKNRNRFVD